jgi:IS5 family transposase
MERVLAPLRAPTGRPGYPPLAMFRALLLAQWYQLSDPGLEEALADRLSFRRFCGFGLDDGTPDETTLCRFRAALAERGLAETLFTELNRQLDTKGLVLKAGTLIDATLVEAAVARPPHSDGEVSTKDPEAGFTRRGQRSFFGFKAHVAVDLGSDLIRDAVLTSADVGDSLAADGLVQGDEAAVFMDKAYDSAARREALAEAGIVDGIMHRGHARRPLAAWQRWMNTALAPIRGQVERAFGTLKRSYGWRRVRYRGLVRNGAHLPPALHRHEPPSCRKAPRLTGQARPQHDRRAPKPPKKLISSLPPHLHHRISRFSQGSPMVLVVHIRPVRAADCGCIGPVL